MDAFPKFFDPKRQEDDFKINIDRNGQWYHDNTPITRHRLSELFATALYYDSKNNEYWLVTPHEQGRIKVDDVPYIVVDFEWDNGDLKLITNLNHHIFPNNEHPISIKNGIPYIIVTNNTQARINRNVREKLIHIALEQNGYNTDTGNLTLKANGHDHIIART